MVVIFYPMDLSAPSYAIIAGAFTTYSIIFSFFFLFSFLFLFSLFNSFFLFFIFLFFLLFFYSFFLFFFSSFFLILGFQLKNCYYIISLLIQHIMFHLGYSLSYASLLIHNFHAIADILLPYLLSIKSLFS